MTLEITQLVKSEGPFTHFHLKVTTGDTIAGDIILNEKKIYSFNKGGSETTLSEIQSLILNGKNTLVICTQPKDAILDEKLFTKNPICLRLYASNTHSLPAKEDEILCINWPPKKGLKSADVHYIFVVRTQKKKTTTQNQ